MLGGLQVLPLPTHVLVRLHLWHCFSPFETIALKPLDEVVENQHR